MTSLTLRCVPDQRHPGLPLTLAGMRIHFSSAASKLALTMLCVVGAGCATVLGPRTITLTEADVARQIAKLYPLERKLLGELTVRVEAPRVKLLSINNRIATDLDFSGSLDRSGKVSRGTIALDYALRFDDAAQAVRMTQVRVVRVQIDGRVDNMNDRPKAVVDKFGALLAEQLLNDAAIYRFKPEDLKAAEGKGYKPGSVTVTSRGVEITMVPVTR
jgi:hypothetical protein